MSTSPPANSGTWEDPSWLNRPADQLPAETILLLQSPAFGKLLDELYEIKQQVASISSEVTSGWYEQFYPLMLTQEFSESLHAAMGHGKIAEKGKSKNRWDHLFTGPAFYALVEHEGEVVSVFGLTWDCESKNYPGVLGPLENEENGDHAMWRTEDGLWLHFGTNTVVGSYHQDLLRELIQEPVNEETRLSYDRAYQRTRLKKQTSAPGQLELFVKPERLSRFRQRLQDSITRLKDQEGAPFSLDAYFDANDSQRMVRLRKVTSLVLPLTLAWKDLTAIRPVKLPNATLNPDLTVSMVAAYSPQLPALAGAAGGSLIAYQLLGKSQGILRSQRLTGLKDPESVYYFQAETESGPAKGWLYGRVSEGQRGTSETDVEREVWDDGRYAMHGRTLVSWYHAKFEDTPLPELDESQLLLPPMQTPSHAIQRIEETVQTHPPLLAVTYSWHPPVLETWAWALEDHIVLGLGTNANWMWERTPEQESKWSVLQNAQRIPFLTPQQTSLSGVMPPSVLSDTAKQDADATARNYLLEFWLRLRVGYKGVEGYLGRATNLESVHFHRLSDSDSRLISEVVLGLR